VRNERSDLELIRGVQSGDQGAFEQIVRRYQSRLFNFIFRYIGESQSAEDITQEVFLKVWQAAPSYEPRAEVSTWIFKIAYHFSLNELGRRKRYRIFHEAFCREEVHICVSEPTISRELESEIMQILDKLPENQRAALLMRVNEGFSYREISQILNTSVSAVESLIFRARTCLRQLRSRRRHDPTMGV
jgi:RNA polymerase sigma-70 factor (ECF subfamily)